MIGEEEEEKERELESMRRFLATKRTWDWDPTMTLREVASMLGISYEEFEEYAEQEGRDTPLGYYKKTIMKYYERAEEEKDPRWKEIDMMWIQKSFEWMLKSIEKKREEREKERLKEARTAFILEKTAVGVLRWEKEHKDPLMDIGETFMGYMSDKFGHGWATMTFFHFYGRLIKLGRKIGGGRIPHDLDSFARGDRAFFSGLALELQRDITYIDKRRLREMRERMNAFLSGIRVELKGLRDANELGLVDLDNFLDALGRGEVARLWIYHFSRPPSVTRDNPQGRTLKAYSLGEALRDILSREQAWAKDKKEEIWVKPKPRTEESEHLLDQYTKIEDTRRREQRAIGQGKMSMDEIRARLRRRMEKGLTNVLHEIHRQLGVTDILVAILHKMLFEGKTFKEAVQEAKEEFIAKVSRQTHEEDREESMHMTLELDL